MITPSVPGAAAAAAAAESGRVRGGRVRRLEVEPLGQRLARPRRTGTVLRLGRHEPVIGPAPGHQLRVRARLRDAPVVEGEDAVGADHARQAMREDQRRAPLHEPVERLLDHRLALRVHRRERLVQDQDGRISQERPRDGDALALAAGEPHPALAHDGLIALGQARDELLRIGGARGRGQLGRRRVGLAHAQVVLHGAVEEVGVLAHHRDEAPELVEGEIPHVAAADQDAALIGVVEAQQQARHGGLARAARPDDAHPLARANGEAQAVVRRPPPARIRKAHGLERDGRFEPRRVRRGGGRTVAHQGLGVEDPEDALRGGDAEHALVQQRAQLAQRPEDLDAEHEHDDERGEIHLPRAHSIGAPAEGHRRADRDARIRDAPGQRVGPQHAHGALEERLALGLQQLAARRALPVRLERAEPLDGIEELRAEGGIGPRALHAPRPVHAMPGAGRDERDEGGDEEDERDRQIHEGHEGEDEDGRERRDEELRDVLAEVDLELLDALDHRQDHVARARPREVGGAERGDVVVERLPEPRLHARRRVVGDHVPVEIEHAPQHDGGGGERGRHARAPAGARPR